MPNWDQQDFESEILYSERPELGVWSWILPCTVLLFCIIAFFWAKHSDLEEVTRGEGRIVPFGKIQIVQSLEGGIIDAIHVSVGERVSEGQVLINIDDTDFTASVGEIEARRDTLQGKIARLQAEFQGRSRVDFGAIQNAEVIASETRLFNLRRSSLFDEINVLKARKEQREQEYEEYLSSRIHLNREFQLAKTELHMNEKVSDLVPQSEIIRLRRETGRLEGEISGVENNIIRAQAAIREAESQILKERSAFKAVAQAELNEAQGDLNVIQAGTKAADDRVDRAGIKSPVDGIINAIHINTLGGVIQPGRDLVEIVPFSGTIQIEARIRPQDIAFLSPNQLARVKITAYDYSIYGGLDGFVERIGADSLTDEVTGETYFPIDIVADASNFKDGDTLLTVSPGMVASVDILTGNKSILEYIFKPINKARFEAMRER